MADYKKRFTFTRLVQIALSFYDEVKLGELVEEVSYLTRRYYRKYYPPDEQFKKKVVDALLLLRAWRKVVRVKKGVWSITEYGLRDLAKYHLNVRRLPDELMTYDVRALVDEILRNKKPPFSLV